MIYTLTLNPAIDITLSTSALNRDEINITSLESVAAGGKGFNTSRALSCLGVKNTAIALCGGFFKKDMEEFLHKEKFRAHLISIAGNTRVNIKVIEKQSKKLIEFNEAGPSIKESESEALLCYIKGLEPKPEFFIISGSLPKKIAPKIYSRIIAILKSGGTKTLLDTSGQALYYGMLELPDVIKINMRELEEVSEKYFKNNPQKVIGFLLKRGIKMIMITNGPEPVRAYGAEGDYSVISPDINGPYKTGSGDSVNAGIIYALLNGYAVEDMLKFSVACGNVNIMTRIPGMLDIVRVNEIASLVTVRKDAY
jgi:1-phosphofructokinase family hexose kinase